MQCLRVHTPFEVQRWTPASELLTWGGGGGTGQKRQRCITQSRSSSSLHKERNEQLFPEASRNVSPHQGQVTKGEDAEDCRCPSTVDGVPRQGLGRRTPNQPRLSNLKGKERICQAGTVVGWGVLFLWRCWFDVYFQKLRKSIQISPLLRDTVREEGSGPAPARSAVSHWRDPQM